MNDKNARIKERILNNVRYSDDQQMLVLKINTSKFNLLNLINMLCYTLSYKVRAIGRALLAMVRLVLSTALPYG